MFARDGERTTKGRAKLILLEIGLQARRDQGIESVKGFVSNELPPRSVEPRRPGLGDHIDDSAHHATERCIVVVRLNLELLDVVDDRGNCIGAAERPFVIHAIQQE